MADTAKSTPEPQPPAPALRCPVCDASLKYVRTFFGGVKPRNERWDWFSCAQCGDFEYRQRTRRMRPAGPKR